jgi:hydroxyacylglutathione hydrolase
MPSTTLGYERLANWAFQIDDENTFVEQVTAGQPEPPRYFARMKRINRAGPAPLPHGPLPALSFDTIQRAVDAGDPVVDVRATKEFAESHVPGTINIPVGTSFATWAGSLLPDDRPIILLADDPARIARARSILQSIGLDDVAGYAGPEFREAWLSRVSQLQSTPQVDVQRLASDKGRVILDVRRQSEWDEAHIPHARHTYLGDLVELTRDLPRDTPIAVHCQGGTRSAIAASVLQREGFTNVENMAGGIEEWEKKGLPVEKA